jgi:urease accessory protein
MLTLNTKIDRAESVFAQLVLPYEMRENSRLRTALASGEEVAIFTVRGTILRNNDLLKSDDGRIVQIIAAHESTYRITCRTPYDLLRCAFHLGNRHTQTQVGEAFLRILQDDVLKQMLEGLGATVIKEEAPFEPETGAYSGGGHHHHDDDHHHAHGPLAPIPARQKIHRPSDSPSQE